MSDADPDHDHDHDHEGHDGHEGHDHRVPVLTDPLPSAHPAVASVVVEGSAVLYDERSGRCHVLNPTASVIWSCLGTGGTAEDLVVDLAEAYATPADVIADDVLQTLGMLEERHLVDDGRPRLTPKPLERRYLEEADNACMQAVDRLGWAPAIVGVELPTGIRVGVRTDSEATAEAVRRALASVLVDDDSCPPNLSIRLEPQDEGPVRSLHTVFRSCSLALRTRRRSRAVEALGHQLWALAATDRDDAVLLAATALERDGRVVLAPSRLRARIDHVEPRLRRFGIAVVDAPLLELEDGEAASIVVPEPGVQLWADLDDPADRRAAIELPAARPGTYAVVGRMIVGDGESEDEIPSSALLAGAIADVANVRRVGGAAALAAASRLQALPTTVSPSWGATPLVDAIVALFEDG